MLFVLFVAIAVCIFLFLLGEHDEVNKGGWGNNRY